MKQHSIFFAAILTILAGTMNGQCKLGQEPVAIPSYLRLTLAASDSTVTIPYKPYWQIGTDVAIDDNTEYWSTAENFAYGKDRGEIPMINDLDALHPYFRDRIALLIARCKKKGIELQVVETYRTRAKQQEYYVMGRKYTRSNGGKSKHQFGLAADVVPFVNGEPVWNNKYLWRKIGLVGESLGLRWGGRWRSLYDPGHFEWTGGLTSYQLAQGHLPNIPRSSPYPCVEEDMIDLRRTWEYWEQQQSQSPTASQKNKIPLTSVTTTTRPQS